MRPGGRFGPLDCLSICMPASPLAAKRIGQSLGYGSSMRESGVSALGWSRTHRCSSRSMARRKPMFSSTLAPACECAAEGGAQLPRDLLRYAAKASVHERLTKVCGSTCAWYF